MRDEDTCRQIFLIDDDAGCRTTDRNTNAPRQFKLYQIGPMPPRVLGEVARSNEAAQAMPRSEAVAALLERYSNDVTDAMVVAGRHFGDSASLIQLLTRRGHRFAVELSHSTVIERPLLSEVATIAAVIANESEQSWQKIDVLHPVTKKRIPYAAFKAGHVKLPDDVGGFLTVMRIGGIGGLARGSVAVLSSFDPKCLEDLADMVGWTRWIRPYERKIKRPSSKGVRSKDLIAQQGNLPLGPSFVSSSTDGQKRPLRIANISERSENSRREAPINIVELFSGAGGMGLGFLLANPKANYRYRILASAELHPVYVETLRRNHSYYRALSPKTNDYVPQSVDPIDLTSDSSLELLSAVSANAGRVDLVIGGPPCQGFSSANRNSWHSDNPNNRLVETYLNHVENLLPKVFIMENVEGIMYTPKAGQQDEISVLDHFAHRMRKNGYMVFPTLIDAAQYGVPQHRTRFFVIGLHTDIGLGKGDFPNGRLFPEPTHGPGTSNNYVSVADAIGDLPIIGNGETSSITKYFQPKKLNNFLVNMRIGAIDDVVTDHITSRHAPYVIERYREIPPGGNWRDIEKMLTNYASAERTHSNIYRRLTWTDPSVTIGHYRKSMLVHPDQHRGLSLREATRLQSFPDWFRFVGSTGGQPDTIGHKQQQVANAVCPLVTKALAEFIAEII